MVGDEVEDVRGHCLCCLGGFLMLFLMLFLRLFLRLFQAPIAEVLDGMSITEGGGDRYE